MIIDQPIQEKKFTWPWTRRALLFLLVVYLLADHPKYNHTHSDYWFIFRRPSFQINVQLNITYYLADSIESRRMVWWKPIDINVWY